MGEGEYGKIFRRVWRTFEKEFIRKIRNSECVMRNFIAEGDFLGTFADKAVSGAAKNIHSSLGCGYFYKQRTSPLRKTKNSLLR